jgi:hypothetical protein
VRAASERTGAWTSIIVSDAWPSGQAGTEAGDETNQRARADHNAQQRQHDEECVSFGGAIVDNHGDILSQDTDAGSAAVEGFSCPIEMLSLIAARLDDMLDHISLARPSLALLKRADPPSRQRHGAPLP